MPDQPPIKVCPELYERVRKIPGRVREMLLTF
jgi:hypothetical protein